MTANACMRPESKLRGQPNQKRITKLKQDRPTATAGAGYESAAGAVCAPAHGSAAAPSSEELREGGAAVLLPRLHNKHSNNRLGVRIAPSRRGQPGMPGNNDMLGAGFALHRTAILLVGGQNKRTRRTAKVSAFPHAPGQPHSAPCGRTANSCSEFKQSHVRMSTSTA